MSFSANVSELVETSEAALVQAAPGWPRVPLGCVATILNGFPFKSEYFQSVGGDPLIRIRDVTGGRTETRYAGPPVDGYWVAPGDLIVGMDGDFNSRIWGSERGLLNQRVCKITPDARILDLRFLAFLLPGYLRLINEATHSVTVKHLSSKTLQEIPLPLPPLAEQRRLVAKLDALTGRTARARADLDRIPALAARYKQAVLARAFSGELTAGWRRQAGVGATWHLTNIGSLATDVRYGTATKCAFSPSETPVLRIPNIAKGRIDTTDLKHASFDEKERAKLALKAGDVLVIRSNGSLTLVGRSAVATDEVAGFLYAGYLIRLRLNMERVSPDFLQLAFEEPSIRGVIEGFAKSTSGVNNINSEQLKSLMIPLPSLVEQTEIVRRVEAAFAEIDRLTDEAAAARRLLDRLDQAILARAFRGELVPQDPADEPASVLLERIRAERAAAPKAKRSRGAASVQAPIGVVR